MSQPTGTAALFGLGRRPSGLGASVEARSRRPASLLAALASLALLLATATASLPGTAPGQGQGAAGEAVLPQAASLPQLSSPRAEGRSSSTSDGAKEAYAKLPLAFVPNAGQTDEEVRYHAQGGGFSFYFTDDKAVLAFQKGGRGQALELRFLGANPTPELHASDRGPGRVNYLRGSEHHTNIPTYHRLTYRELWPGIDMVFRGQNGKLKYEFALKPGANPNDIRLAYAGAESLSLGAAGALRIDTPLGTLRDSRPTSYQRTDGRRVPVDSRYALAGESYGFALGGYDRNKPLVIDPSLAYSTFLGGSSTDAGIVVAVDASESAYVTGVTFSADFPTSPGAFDPSLDGSQDAFVTKLSPSGSSLVYSTYLGGSGNEGGEGVAVDASGSAYVTGLTDSANFPTTASAFDPSVNGSSDAFVTKLSSTGSSLMYSTYLGGSLEDTGSGIAVDASGSAYLTGQTNSADFPTTGGAFDPSHNGSFDVFVTKVSSTGSSLLYSTYLGGAGLDGGGGVSSGRIAVDASGSAYVTGQTGSADFPTTAGAFDLSLGGSFDAFITKLSSTGSSLVYSTYLGGSDTDQGSGVAIDASGSAYLTGLTGSGFPTTAGAHDTSFNGGADAFVTKLSSTGSTLAFSTYLGGSADEQGIGIAVDASGSAYVTGGSGSVDFPTTADALDASLGGSLDAFVTKLSSTGSNLVFSTYLGGSNFDRGFGMAVDDSGSAYVTGQTGSADFPTTAGAFDRSSGGSADAFVTKISFGPGSPNSITLGPSTATNQVGEEHCVTATVRDASGNPVPGVVVRFRVTGANSATGQATTGPQGRARFCYTGQKAGQDTISAFADSNGDGDRDPGEPQATATKTYRAAAPASLTLAPASDTNPVGTEHCVIATVRDRFGNPAPNIVVRFRVTGANTASGQATTNAQGRARFCYVGQRAGQDTISAFADTDRDGARDPGEPQAQATKTWTQVPSARLDHFTYYPLEQGSPAFQPRTVTVRDQFRTTQTRVVAPLRLLNPADKNGEGIGRPNAHLKCYEIEESRFAARTVTVQNQFETRAYQVRQPTRLCNPAAKALSPATPGPIPSGLDHFRCYGIEAGALNRPVSLRDQFGRQQAVVGEPEYLCNPASKNGSPIENPAAHLVCYELREVDPFAERRIALRDQFGVQSFSVEDPTKLCVPSAKRG